MGLSDVSGVFSRYFIVGFFAPSFFGLAGLKVGLSEEWLPKALQPDKAGAFLAIGGLALLVALVLLGLNYSIIRLFEGYPFARPARGRVSRLARVIGEALIAAQQREYDELDRLRKEPGSKRWATWELRLRFPRERTDLLPTRLGNAIRAFELLPRRRWGLSTVRVWPRIQALMSDDERELEADARGEFAFFLNASVISTLTGTLLVADGAVNDPHPDSLLWLYYIPFVLGYVFYRGSVGAAIRWGVSVQAAFDLHRLELYEKLGVRDATSFADEREIAAAVSTCLLWGIPLPEPFWGPPKPKPNQTQASSGGSSSGSPGTSTGIGGSSGSSGLRRG